MSYPASSKWFVNECGQKAKKGRWSFDDRPKSPIDNASIVNQQSSIRPASAKAPADKQSAICNPHSATGPPSLKLRRGRR